MMITSIVTSPYPLSKSKSVLFLSLLAALIAAPAWAQTQIGALFGTVTDTSGAVVPGAEVSVENVNTGLKREAVNEPPGSQNIFDRKGSRGRSSFDIRDNFVANVVYELPFGRGSPFGGWEVSGVASVHSNVPFTLVLSFDNADLQSLTITERPNLAGNPYTGSCPNGAKAGTPTCWFNPAAFALPPPGQFGTAGRNVLRGPGFAQLDLALQKSFQVREGTKIVLRAETFNFLNHPNFAVPSNTQSPLTLGGNGDAVFKSSAGDFADNSGRIFTTIGAGRQVQLDARFIF